MIITKQELQEYNKSDRKSSLIGFVERMRNKVISVAVKPELSAPSAREELYAKLDAAGLEYKKNMKTSVLEEMLEGVE